MNPHDRTGTVLIGPYRIAPAVRLAIPSRLANAWVLLVEILR